MKTTKKSVLYVSIVWNIGIFICKCFTLHLNIFCWILRITIFLILIILLTSYGRLLNNFIKSVQYSFKISSVVRMIRSVNAQVSLFRSLFVHWSMFSSLLRSKWIMFNKFNIMNTLYCFRVLSDIKKKGEVWNVPKNHPKRRFVQSLQLKPNGTPQDS